MRRVVPASVAALAIASALLAALAALAAEPAGTVRTIDVSRVFDAGLPQVPQVGPPSPTPPDPEPLDLGAPQPTPRVMGRFALELFKDSGPGGGRVIVERVRFDFPMLGAPEAPGPDGGAPGSSFASSSYTPSFTRNLRTRIGVVFPAASAALGGTRLELVDRSSGRRWTLPWPPLATPATSAPTRPSSADGSAASFDLLDASHVP